MHKRVYDALHVGCHDVSVVCICHMFSCILLHLSEPADSHLKPEPNITQSTLSSHPQLIKMYEGPCLRPMPFAEQAAAGRPHSVYQLRSSRVEGSFSLLPFSVALAQACTHEATHKHSTCRQPHDTMIAVAQACARCKAGSSWQTWC